MKKYISSILIFLILLGIPGAVMAGNNTKITATDEMSEEDKAALLQKQQELEEINSKLTNLKTEQKNKTAQKKNLNGQILQKQDEVEILEDQVAALEAEINEDTENINLLNEEIAVTEAGIEERLKYLNNRLIDVYVNGDITLWDVLFSSTSLTDFLTRYDLYAKILENDMTILTGIEVDKQLLSEDKNDLAILVAEKEEKQAALEEQMTTLNSEKTELEATTAKLSKDIKALEEAEDDLEDLTTEILAFVKEIQSKYASAYMGSGTMGWPLESYTSITSKYGYRIHPIYKTKKFHSGIDIAAPKETPVLSSETGKVIMATTYGGYGKTIIVDHGGGVSTQYSHLNSMAVSVGDTVLKGQKIGGVGTTGTSTGNHLHFMIMVNGATVDPLGSGTYYVREP